MDLRDQLNQKPVITVMAVMGLIVLLVGLIFRQLAGQSALSGYRHAKW
ncbi:MAG: hypothetical protein ABSH08_08415 [Tepidisphaeraceae bacterium]